MIKKLTLAILLLVSTSAYALRGKMVEDLKGVHGYYSDGESCIKVTSMYLKKMSYCNYKPIGDDSTHKYECFFISKKKQFSHYVYESKKICREAIEMEQVNGF